MTFARPDVIHGYDPSNQRTAIALERIADTLDDYMEMSLAGIEMTNAIRAGIDNGADLLALLGPLTDTLVAIRERRAAR